MRAIVPRHPLQAALNTLVALSDGGLAGTLACADNHALYSRSVCASSVQRLSTAVASFDKDAYGCVATTGSLTSATPPGPTTTAATATTVVATTAPTIVFTTSAAARTTAMPPTTVLATSTATTVAASTTAPTTNASSCSDQVASEGGCGLLISAYAS